VSFASYGYLVFLAAAFVLHWALPARLRRPFLVLASYAFYASWNWPYAFLLLAVSIFSWAWGLLLEKKEEPGGLLLIGIAVELAPLLYFKYTNFFVQNLGSLARVAGAHWQPRLFDIALPLGISFFTFQGIAYLVDVATGEPPFRRLRDFVLYKAFWPQLIAGPIVRPAEIREQIEEDRTLSYDDLAEGAKRIVAGLFKKMVVADLVGTYVDQVFVPNAHPAAIDGIVAILGFGLQVYFDFAGYSDVAIGSARLFGYRFPENFDWPYVSRSPQEFWARWHMSLSRWIRDYVFTPISFTFRSSPRMGLVGLVFAMALCGLWHGAAWTFVLWGVWHGVFLVLNQTLLKRLFAGLDGDSPARTSARGLAAALVTLFVANAGWLLFRAQSVQQALEIARAIVTLRGGLRPAVLRENGVLIVGLVYCGTLAAQMLRPRSRRLVAALGAWPRFRNAAFGTAYALSLLAIVVFDQEAKTFVYFQF
jgi:alginate O-acetyltransferase complex protein AlgI